MREIGLKIGVVLCVCPIVLYAATVYSRTAPADFSGLYGGVDCKGPCAEDPIKQRYECLDLTGPPCIPTGCVMNEYHTVSCQEGMAGPEDKCETHWSDAPGTWYRRWSVHQVSSPCNSSTSNTWNLNKCQFNIGDLTYKITPCVTDACTGVMQARTVYPGQFKCGPAP